MLYKRAGSPYWQIEFTIRGKTVRRSSGTDEKPQAERLEEKLRHEAWEAGQLGVAADHTWDVAVKRWLIEKNTKRSLNRDIQILRDASQAFAGKALRDIVDEIPEYAAMVAEHTSKANANHHLAILRALLRRAVSAWRWKGIDTTVVMYHTDKYEPRWLTPAEFDKLSAELPEHQKPMAKCAVTTGLRLSNVLLLKRVRPPVMSPSAWPWLAEDMLTLTVPGIVSKSKKMITIPISKEAQQLFITLPPAPDDYVFKDHLDRAPVGTIHGAWERACERAGLAGLRFHDLRHTWASWKLQAGVPEAVVQQLGGWQSRQMVSHYGHWNIEALREYV